MPIAPEEFQERIKAKVRAHYAATRAPLLLSNLGAEIEKENAWPTDRGQRNLKQLILETCGPDLDIVRDKRSPAYIAVVTPEFVRTLRRKLPSALAKTRSCPSAGRRSQTGAVGILHQRGRPADVRKENPPFRYEVGSVPADRVGDYIVVEREYRRPV